MQPIWASGLGWLSEQTGIKSPQLLRERVLYPNKKELEEFVDFPQRRGEHWRFHIELTREWLDENFKGVRK